MFRHEGARRQRGAPSAPGPASPGPWPTALEPLAHRRPPTSRRRVCALHLTRAGLGCRERASGRARKGIEMCESAICGGSGSASGLAGRGTRRWPTNVRSHTFTLSHAQGTDAPSHSSQVLSPRSTPPRLRPCGIGHALGTRARTAALPALARRRGAPPPIPTPEFRSEEKQTCCHAERAAIWRSGRGASKMY